MSDRLSTADRDWINEMLQYKDEDREVIEDLQTLSTRTRPDIVQGTCDKVNKMLPAFHIRREVTAENVAHLIDKMKEVNEKQEDLLVVYSQWCPVRKLLIEKLLIVAEKMDEYRYNSNCGILKGSSASLVGGGGMMVGLFYCLPLVPVGLALTVWGSKISVVSSLLEIGFSKYESNNIQRLLDDDKEETEKLIRALNGFNHINNELKKWIGKTRFTDEELRACAYAIKIRCTTASLCSVVMSTCAFLKKYDKHSDGSIVELFIGILQNIGLAFDVSNIKDKMLSSKGLDEDDISRLHLGIAIKCIPVFSVIIDIMTIAKVLVDFKKGSKSEAADNMRTVAKQYRQGQTDMEDIMNKVFPSRKK